MSTRLRLVAPVLAVAFAVAACGTSASPSPSPTAAPTASPTATPAASATPAGAAFCSDAAAFRASILALTNLKPLEVGTSGVKAAVTAVADSAQALLLSGKDLVATPLANLVASVKALQATLTGLGDQQGLGASLIAVKAAIESIKSAAADVEAVLGTSCPAQ